MEFWKIIKNIKVEDLIFMDEAGVNLVMVRLSARSLKGQRALGKKPQKRGKNISLVSALSLQKMLGIATIYGAVDGLTFEAIVVRKLVPQLWQGACVVMDNAKIHQGYRVKEAIEAVGARLIYFRPTLPIFPPLKTFGQRSKLF